jgi:lysophospholipase L1-like esterase
LAFLAGVSTALAMAAILAAFAAWRLGLGSLGGAALTVALPRGGDAGDVDLPPLSPGQLQELIGLGAIVDNAENPTGAPDHDNMLVRPDAERGYVLRPGSGVDAYMLASGQALDLDPPVLYMPPGAAMSPSLREYAERHTRLRYSFGVDARGFRRTLPEVESPRKVLMVGDSVLFGVGVDDEATMASALQARVGSDVQIVNAGVGEYGTDEIHATADVLSSRERYEALVYVACQNDFDEESPEAYLASASRMLRELARLAPRFGGRVAVLLATAMEHTLFDILQEDGWPPELDAATTHLRAGLPAVAAGLGFAYVDWAELVAPTSQQEGTLFHRFALYVDHVHFSPLGNRLAARELHRVLAGWGLGGSAAAAPSPTEPSEPERHPQAH